MFIVRNVIHLPSFGLTEEGQKISDAASGLEQTNKQTNK